MSMARETPRKMRRGTPVTMRDGEPGTILAVLDRSNRVRVLVHPGDVRPTEDVDARLASWHLAEHLTTR